MSDEQTNPPPAPPVHFDHFCDYPGCVKWGEPSFVSPSNSAVALHPERRWNQEILVLTPRFAAIDRLPEWASRAGPKGRFSTSVFEKQSKICNRKSPLRTLS